MPTWRLLAIAGLLSVSSCHDKPLRADNPAHCLASFVTVLNLAKGHPAEHDRRIALLSEAAAFELYKAKLEGRVDVVERESEDAAKQMMNNHELAYTLGSKCTDVVFADPGEKAFARTWSGGLNVR